MILALAFIVASLLVLFDFIQPTYGDVQTLRGKQVADEDFLTQEQNVVTQAQNLLAQYKSQGTNQSQLALAMPSGPDVAGGLAQIYGLAALNGLTVQSITLSTPVVAAAQSAQTLGGTNASPLTASQIVKPMGTLTIQMTGTASYEGLKSFLSGLETNIRIFDVTGISIQPANITVTGKSVSFNNDLFSYNMTVVTYYQTL